MNDQSKTTYWVRPLHTGQFSRRVCWLVVPTVVDLQIPDDHTIMYVLTNPPEPGRYPTTIVQSIDRGLVQEESRQMYIVGREHNFLTRWYDPQGNIVKKWDVINRVKAQVESRLIAEHEASPEFRMEHDLMETTQEAFERLKDQPNVRTIGYPRRPNLRIVR